MSRNEFLTILAETLCRLPKEEQNEILFDYEEHFRIGMKEGKTEEEISASLGDPRILGRQFAPEPLVEKSWKPVAVKAVLAIAALLCVAALFFSISVNKAGSSLSGIQQVNGQPTGQSTDSTSNSKTEHRINIEKTLSLDQVNTLTINSITGIQFINTDAAELKVHLYGEVTTSNNYIPDLEVTAGSNRLTIGMTRTPANTYYHSSNLKMDVYLPKTYSQSIFVSTVSGPVKIGDLTLDTLDCRSVSGPLEIQNISSKRITAETTSGPIRLDTIQADLNAKSVSGSITASYKVFNHAISTENVSGNVNLKLPENAEFAFHAKTVSGKITNNFPMTNTSSDKGKSINGVVKSDSNQITASTVSGSISVSK